MVTNKADDFYLILAHGNADEKQKLMAQFKTTLSDGKEDEIDTMILALNIAITGDKDQKGKVVNAFAVAKEYDLLESLIRKGFRVGAGFQ